MLWPREKRWLLDLITRCLWPREKRWPLRLIKRCYGRARAITAPIDYKTLWPREKRWLLALITKRFWSRKNCRSSRALTSSVAPLGVSRANSFRTASGLLARQQLP